MKEDTPSNSALTIALARAMETCRITRPRICADPLAVLFLTDDLRRAVYNPAACLARRMYWESFAPGVPGMVAARTRYFDDCLLQALHQGIDQLVLLGAGYDTRPYRFAGKLSGVRVIEADHPATQARKRLSLHRAGLDSGRVSFAPVDFDRDSLPRALADAGYDPAGRTFFIWEGVSYFIPIGGVAKTMEFMAAGGNAQVVFDYFPPTVASGEDERAEARSLRAFFIERGEPFRSGIVPGDLPEFLAGYGFKVHEHLDHRHIRARYFHGINRFVPLSVLFRFVHAGTRDAGKTG